MPLSISVKYRRPREPRGSAPLTPQRKWRAITVATLVLAPAFWSMLAGFVAIARDEDTASAPAAGPAIALGLALIPFAFIALAFLSEHSRAPMAVVKAMTLTLLVGIPVSAIAGDAVTGLVAGVGAGGIVSLRAEDDHSWKARAIAVAIAAAYAFCLVRTAGAITLVSAPIFPLTSIGIADHFSERKHERQTMRA